MQSINKKRWLGIFLLFLFAASGFLMAQSADSQHVANLLAKASSQANTAAQDADILQSYTRSKLSLSTHQEQIDRIRENVNALGRTVEDLKTARSEGSPWQQEAIDRIDPLLQEIADTLTATIKHLNDNPSQIHMQPYRDYVTATYDLTHEMAATIRDFVQYGKAKGRIDKLEQKLEMPPSGSGN
jgi:cell division protein FtsB